MGAEAVGFLLLFFPPVGLAFSLQQPQACVVCLGRLVGVGRESVIVIVQAVCVEIHVLHSWTPFL